jgi:hypothetical protein
MRDCPKCGAFVDGLRCKSCGYAEPGAKASDPDRYRCEHVDRGQRCAGVGSISPSIHGTGPWFCAQHMPGLGERSSESAPAGTFEALRALTKRVVPVPKPLDIEGELERIAIETEAANDA